MSEETIEVKKDVIQQLLEKIEKLENKVGVIKVHEPEKKTYELTWLGFDKTRSEYALKKDLSYEDAMSMRADAKGDHDGCPIVRRQKGEGTPFDVKSTPIKRMVEQWSGIDREMVKPAEKESKPKKVKKAKIEDVE